LAAQRQLKEDRAKVENYLDRANMTNRVFSSITIEELHAQLELDMATNGERLSQEKTVGYKLKQSVEVRSSDVDRISQLDSDSTSLVEQGVMLTTEKPKYFYTKVAEEKVEMLADATRDARTRATRIAEQGGSHVGGLHSADMGVFQITPLNSVETSWEGMNDTSSLDKTITAIVTSTFLLK
jgi:hypothetical protein